MINFNKTEDNAQVKEIELDTFDSIIDRAANSGSSDDMNVVLNLLSCIVSGSLMVTE